MTKRLNAPEFEQSTDIVDPIMIFPIRQRVEGLAKGELSDVIKGEKVIPPD